MLQDKIPVGPYCYEILEVEGMKMHIRKCPHWELLGKGKARCNLLGIQDDDENTLGLLWDSVKECGINMG